MANEKTNPEIINGAPEVHWSVDENSLVSKEEKIRW